MDRDALEQSLTETFDGTERGARIVARQARDLADAGRIEAELGFELTTDAVVANLQDAPETYSLVERWNWWLGSLELSHGGYDRFQVRPDAVED